MLTLSFHDCSADIAIAKCRGLRLRLYLAAYTGRSNKRRMLYLRAQFGTALDQIADFISLRLSCQTTCIWGGVDVHRTQTC
jgi:hypothetical protein